jgi:hypothetical protein
LAAITRLYGRSHPVRHKTHAYSIAGQTVTAGIDHQGRVGAITSQGAALTLYGRRLLRGFGFWKQQLADHGWSLPGCISGLAISPRRLTELIIEPPDIYVQIDAAGFAAGCGGQ